MTINRYMSLKISFAPNHVHVILFGIYVYLHAVKNNMKLFQWKSNNIFFRFFLNLCSEYQSHTSDICIIFCNLIHSFCSRTFLFSDLQTAYKGIPMHHFWYFARVFRIRNRLCFSVWCGQLTFIALYVGPFWKNSFFGGLCDCDDFHSFYPFLLICSYMLT